MSKGTLADAKFAIEAAINETDQVLPRGGHRHGQSGRIARAGFVDGWWIAYAKIKGRWKVVGRYSNRFLAEKVARQKARP